MGTHTTSPGYSLLELLVVLAVVGLIAGLAGPAAVASVERMTLSADARMLATHLRSWRDDALDQQMEVVVSSDGASGVSASTGETVVLATGTVVETLGDGRFVIGPDGGAEGGLRLSRGGSSVRVLMNRMTGRVTIVGAR